MNRKHLITAGLTVITLVTMLAVGLPAAFASPPMNDDISGAVVIDRLNFSYTQDTVEATAAFDDPYSTCTDWYGGGQQATVWFKYAPSRNAVVSPYVFTYYTAFLTVYQGTPGSLSQIACAAGSYGISTGNFTAYAGQTYYILVGAYSYYPGPGAGGYTNFSFTGTEAPANDNFADATVISALPFSEYISSAAASREADEPTPSCIDPFAQPSWSVWYALTWQEAKSIQVRTDGWGWGIWAAIFTGSDLSTLEEAACANLSWGSRLTLKAAAGQTYFIQISAMDRPAFTVAIEETPPPAASFYYSPTDPSVYETVAFSNSSYDPAGIGFGTAAWKFGDGTTSTEWYASHRYAADGVYTVSLTVTAIDGRTASFSQTVTVKTHDVAITKFSVPQSAKAGQTRQIVVGLNSKLYVEEVEVQLYRSVPGGWQWVGTLRQTVPVRAANRTTDFNFSYTFTAADAAVGKVTFKAVAYIAGGRDALPADNEAITLPTKVSR